MRVALQKIILLLLFFTTLPSFADTEINCEVSAYYSPEKPDTINGKGTHGADGTAVYRGMLSASKKYDFGTKIFVPGLGVGTVHDRGSAVQGNNIDVWLGYGEEGKKRAIAWGRKKMTCIIIDDKNTPDTISFLSNSVYFKTNLEKGDTGKQVQEMQKFLEEQGFFKESDFGYFGEKTENAVFEFQKKYNIVNNKKDEGAGVWGPKTRKKANSLLAK